MYPATDEGGGFAGAGAAYLGNSDTHPLHDDVLLPHLALP